MKLEKIKRSIIIAARALSGKPPIQIRSYCENIAGLYCMREKIGYSVFLNEEELNSYAYANAIKLVWDNKFYNELYNEVTGDVIPDYD